MCVCLCVRAQGYWPSSQVLIRPERMGSGRDKRKKKPSSTASAGKGRAKTERKTMKNQAKKERRWDDRVCVITHRLSKETEGEEMKRNQNCKASIIDSHSFFCVCIPLCTLYICAFMAHLHIHFRLENMTKGGEDDIDALLAQVDLEESRKSSVRVQTNSDAPSPRCHCSFVPIPSSLEKKSQSSDSVRVVLFGGERQAWNVILLSKCLFHLWW